jgi:hypothetical protein
MPMNRKLTGEDYLQGFHNFHHYENDGGFQPEWYELAEAGLPMHGIGIHPDHFSRGGDVDSEHKSGAMLPASVYSHAQHEPGRR